MISFLKKYALKFRYAFAGLFHGITHDHSIALQCILAVLVMVVCCFLKLSKMEWICIVVMIALVIAFEFMNSAIETIVDFVCPQYHESAKKIKDYAAAAVLVVSISAAVVGVIIIGGKLW